MSDDLLLLCGVASGPLFTAVYLLTGALRPDYNSLRHPVSSLSIGRTGWVQVVNFLGCAVLLSSAFAVGLWREGPSRWGAVLIGLWAVGLLGAGIFRADPVRGYPPGSPDRIERPTRVGTLHDAFSMAAFLGLIAACFVYAPHGSAGWTAYSIASGVLFAGAMGWSSAAFSGSPRMAGFGGLLQRVALVVGCGWLTVLALRTLYP
ncbi:DUF998 domain-containing protein [Streptomyces sp. NBC_00237]|uniref:DUF998 domain-containing protein n=1 Tax=Streptomyces sp. NBC_00237 TaxID=2975687 RepID=UPI0022573740|nr:DUF998 domain-containing protein [Streptomyces sp. NBC_00237]MCX5205259.1 DUF998 domain-containing protein [Streptomyces sp. NBC_00237]